MIYVPHRTLKSRLKWAVYALFVAGACGLACTDLFYALTRGAILGRRLNVVFLDQHPGSFWFNVALDAGGLICLGALLCLVCAGVVLKDRTTPKIDAYLAKRARIVHTDEPQISTINEPPSPRFPTPRP